MEGREPDASSEPGKIADIDGIDAEVGLSLAAGRVPDYLKTLSLFFRRLPAERERLSAYLTEGDTQNFSVLVHGLKSSLRIIGATKTAEAALSLERAAKAGDWPFVAANAGAFLDDLLAMNERYDALFAKEPGGEIREKAGAGFIDAALAKLGDAIDSYDSTLSLAILDDILRFSHDSETETALRNLQTALEGFDFDEAAEVMGDLAPRPDFTRGDH